MPADRVLGWRSPAGARWCSSSDAAAALHLSAFRDPSAPELTDSSSALPALELAFVVPTRHHRPTVELAGVLCDELQQAGARASLHVDGFPSPTPELTYVLCSPHEYLGSSPGWQELRPEVLARTIVVCTESPDGPSFDANLRVAAQAGAAFHISRGGIRAFSRAGINADHLQLGWTPRWDHAADNERDVDVLFLGVHTERSGRILSRLAPIFARHRVELVLLEDGIRDPRSGGDRHGRLARAKILVNLCREDAGTLDWLHVAHAMSAGAVVLSEHAVDHSPLRPGEHLVMCDPSSLGLLCEALLEDPARLREMQAAAYHAMRNELPLAHAARRLEDTARRLADTTAVPDPWHLPARTRSGGAMTAGDPSVFRPMSRTNNDLNAAWTRRALKNLRLEMLQLQRAQRHAALQAQTGTPVCGLEQVAQTDAYASATPQVSVITAVYNHARHVAGALTSAARSVDVSFELIVVDDGSSDASSQVVIDWITDHQHVPALLLRHPVNQGVAPARNHALEVARGEMTFVLDADNEVYPHALARLVEALDRDPGAAFAFGIQEWFSGTDCLGLINTLPWQPERLRAANYIDAMALMRTAIVRDEFGGYPSDLRLYGWEDYALWCSLASAGQRGIHVEEILGRYRASRHSMLSLTDISWTEAFSVLIERNPVLMAGVDPPDG